MGGTKVKQEKRNYIDITNNKNLKMFRFLYLTALNKEK